MTNRTAIAVVALLLLAALFADEAGGQYYFGKNKIQYSQFDWYVLQTEHFDVYYYKGEDRLARMAAASAEESYRHLADKFNIELTRTTPVIVYSSPNFFTQTNVIPQLLPENVGGFTEFFKGRVVLPFDGSYHDFDRVLRHELVHVFTYAKLSRVSKDHKKVRVHSPPLWFTEGIAEYWSGDWTPSENMIISDAVLSGLEFNENNIFSISGTYLMYKLGESLCAYMARTYGEEKLLMIFENWWKAMSFREVVEYTFGVPIKEIFDGWRYSLKQEHFPALADAHLPDRVARPLTERGYAVKPEAATLDLGDGQREYLIYKANKLGYSGIYLQELDGNDDEDYEVLVKGERSPQFESLHLLESGLSVSNTGKLAFASRNYECDVLYIYNLRERKVEEKYEFEDLVVIQSPSWSPDGGQLVFTASTRNGFFDLYIYTPAHDSLARLTEDVYGDFDPVFTPDGKRIVFSSDRLSTGDAGYRNLFELDPSDGEITRLTFGNYVDATPSYSPDGNWLVFQSDRGRVPNIYALDSLGTMYRVGRYASGVLDPKFSPDGKRIYFTSYQRQALRIYAMPFSDTLLAPVIDYRKLEDDREMLAWAPREIGGKSVEASYKYVNDFSFDFAQSAVGYDAFWGPVGGMQVGYSDMLGNHQYYLLIYNTATTRGEFLESFNVGINYINREHRLNYGFGAFHLYDEFDNRVDGIYDERQFGGLGLLSYPFSKFRRIELTSVLRKSERFVFYRDSTRHAVLSTNYISYIKDNTIWDMTGPIDGSRYNLTAGMSYDLRSGKSFTTMLLGDIRKYFRLGSKSAFAIRLFGYTSKGEEPQRLYLGGSWSLRGYERRTFYGRNLVLWSNELRFPLIDNLYIGFPLGRLGFSGIRGALFWDTGNAWDEEFDRFYGSFGVGARVALGYMAVLRFDLARTTDYEKISDSWKFDFFFGWNF